MFDVFVAYALFSAKKTESALVLFFFPSITRCPCFIKLVFLLIALLIDLVDAQFGYLKRSMTDQKL